jgi:Zn-dependent M16 (insulinase) family peptidase
MLPAFQLEKYKERKTQKSMAENEKISDAYEVIEKTRVEDIHSDCTLLVHKKSGARVALLANDDNNKVFNIAFRTPPKNSTGVAHIIEHTVLCGSRKFPLKDPFVELVKGSLNTFLNAMTYPDKTMFPVASTNDKDFQNLMDVYLDAVFYPNIYSNEKIFRQEGWHYQLEKKDDPLTYNGVVYNEMKGAFSSADEVLSRTVFNALFPDTPYGVESGGDPEVIPELSYEEFLDFHRKYYHPSNSYICLYGNMDMAEKLDWLDREYLSKFDRIEVDSQIAMQKPFDHPIDIRSTYPVLDSEPTEKKTYLTTNMVIGDYSDVQLDVAFTILEYILLDAPGAPVKQAILDSGIAMDVEGMYNDGIEQPVFSIIAKNAEEKDKDKFLEIIRTTLEKLADEGIDKKAVASAINYYEFRFREADYGPYPKGLMYSIGMFSSWLYDDRDPFRYLRELEAFEAIKEKSQHGFFEDLIRKYLLGNNHAAVVTLVPERGLAAKRDAATAEKLAAYKASLTDGQLDQIVRDTADLKAYQESEDSPEALASLPFLKRSDIDRKTPRHISVEETKVDGTTFLKHHYQTNGIAYLQLLFDTAKVPNDLVPYIGILKNVLGVVDTEHYGYTELFHEVNANTGGIVFGVQVEATDEKDANAGYCMFGIRAKYLYPKQEFVFSIIREILLTSKLDDRKRLKEIIDSTKAGLEVSLPGAGHSTATHRAAAHMSRLDAWTEKISGIDQYHLVEYLQAHFDECADDLIDKLKKLMHIIFRPENLTVSLNAEEAAGGFTGIEDSIRSLRDALFTDDVETGSFEWKEDRGSEGFITPGQVQYVGIAGNFRRAGYEYTGAYEVLKKMLNYDYLWINLRVLGGAYGCMSGFRRDGGAYLVSYRDPHLKRTLDVYKALPDYLRKFDADEDTMTKLVIGTISDIDTPMNASALGTAALNAWYSGRTEADIQKKRDQILDCQPADIRALADPVEAFINNSSVCVIGSQTVIEKDKDAVKNIKSLNDFE